MKNVCIVGFGAIGPVHAEALSHIENARLYAICDINKERADRAGEKYGAVAYYSFDDCLCDKNIDVVHICTPHYLHFEMIIKAIESGKRVVAEKPAVMTPMEWETLEKEYDLTMIFPIVQNRTNTSIARLEQIINEDKSLGKLMGIKGIVTWKRDADYYNSADWRGRKEYEGGGVLINQAIHTLDLMVKFAGGAESVSASCSNLSLTGVIDVEDTAVARIDFKSGVTGIFVATNAYYESTPITLEIEFENKKFIYQDGMLISGGEILCKDSPAYIGKTYWGDGHTKTLADYYSGSEFSLNDIKDTMRLLFGIYESAEIGKKVVL